MATMTEMKKETAMQPTPLRISRILHARRETVFRAWSAAEHVGRWFAPETFTVPQANVEMHVGGPFEVLMRAPDGEQHWTRGTFVEVTPHSRLVIDATVTDAAGTPLFGAYTEVDLADAPGGTRIDVTQTYTVLKPGVEWMPEGAPQGWASTLDKLAVEAAAMERQAMGSGRSVAFGTFSLKRTYDAPLARVWKALTDETAKQQWFGDSDNGFDPIERFMDVRPGGRERVKGRWAGGLVTTFDAVYHDVITNERLVYSYEMYLDERKISVSLATMELTTEGAGTTLKITEQGAFLDGYDDAGSREQGTGHLLDAIGRFLAE